MSKLTSRRTPIDKESYFGLHELFFSLTDKSGRIISGNEVFVKVSKYSVDKLIGAPHNIIRHPDMPRSVFRLLWDTIKENRPIYAYVKNMAADGSWYWVMAAVFPTDKGYLSVRLKPSSSTFKMMQNAYSNALKAEAGGTTAKAMDAGLEIINQAISNAGFATYQEFMTSALIEEIKARDTALNASSPGSVTASTTKSRDPFGLSAVRSETARASHQYANCFEALVRFRTVGAELSQTIQEMQHSFKGLQLIAINMSLAATHIGPQAVTIRTVAESFKNMSTEIQRTLETFVARSTEAMRTLQLVGQSISGSMILADVTSKLLQEMIDDKIATSRSDVMSQCQTLLAMCATTAVATEKSINQTNSTFAKFRIEAVDLGNSAMGLEIIRQTGKIESSTIDGAEHKIDPFIQEMRKFVTAIRGPLQKISEKLTKIVDDLSQIGQISRDVIDTINTAGERLKPARAKYLEGEENSSQSYGGTAHSETQAA